MSIQRFEGTACLLLALFVLLTTGCSPRHDREAPPEPLKLKVLVLPYLSFAPFFIAQEEGFFDEQGLLVEFVQMIHTADAIAALAQGELDAGGVIVTPGLLNAVSRGAKLRLVAGKGYLDPEGCTSNGLVASRALIESGRLTDLNDIAGHYIALRPESLGGYYVEKLLQRAGLGLDDVTVVNLPVPAQPSAMANGILDVSVTQEPWITRLVQSGTGSLWISAQEVVPNLQLAYVMYGPRLLADDLDAGDKFMRAYLKAVKQYAQGKTGRNLAVLARHTGLDEETLRASCWLPIRLDGRIDVAGLLDFQSWALERGFVDRALPLDGLVDDSFARRAAGGSE